VSEYCTKPPHTASGVPPSSASAGTASRGARAYQISAAQLTVHGAGGAESGSEAAISSETADSGTPGTLRRSVASISAPFDPVYALGIGRTLARVHPEHARHRHAAAHRLHDPVRHER
jgi:hypothetical protein